MNTNTLPAPPRAKAPGQDANSLDVAQPGTSQAQPIATVHSAGTGADAGKSKKPGPYKPKSKANGKPRTAPPERVSNAGAIYIEDEDALRAARIYYAVSGQWYAPDGRGSFARVSDSQAKSFVAEHGFNKLAKDGQGNTPAERAMLWLAQSHRVAFAGSLAGYPAGVHESGGIRFLVTESPARVMPKAGNCATVRTLVESLFVEDDGERRQVVCFYLWAARSFAEFHRRMTTGVTDKFRHCPALAMFGPRGCGKSALIDLVMTPLFGGRKADPMNYLRDPKFNKDLFAASLLVLDDKGASANLAERRQRGEGIKDLIWKAEQRMEGKGADAVNLRPFWRLVIAGNDDDAGLQVCPALSPSLEDKLLILRARQAEGLPTNDVENDAWAAAIRAELPAFADYLLTWQPPADVILDSRTRVANFKHPQIVSALRELQPEIRLLELIETLALSSGSHWEGTATEFESAMKEKDKTGLLDRIFYATNSAGRMLSELARIEPARVQKTEHGGCSHYRIFPRTVPPASA